MAAAAPTWTFRLTGGVMTWLIPGSLLLLTASLALFAAVHWSRIAPNPMPSGASVALAIPITLVAVVVIHEALHGVGFAIFGGRPKFGLALVSGFPAAYAACPGRRFTRAQFVVIGALPLVVIDAAALLLGAFPQLTVAAAAALGLNSAGAVADVWTIALLLQAPAGSLFEDSDGRSLSAWHPAGSGARPPVGLNPPGLSNSALTVVMVLTLFPLLLYPLAAFGELLLAQALGGSLQVAGVDITTVGRRGAQVTARQNVGVTLLVAVLLTLASYWAFRRVRRGGKLDR